MMANSPENTPRAVRATDIGRGGSFEKWTLQSESPICVLSSSCYDPKHPPSAVLKKDGTFWSTTGLYPQEIVIGFKDEENLDQMKIMCANIEELQLERVLPSSRKARTGQPPDWKEIEKVHLEDGGNHMQATSVKLNGLATRYLKLKILSGYEDFSCIYEIKIEANGKWLSES